MIKSQIKNTTSFVKISYRQNNIWTSDILRYDAVRLWFFKKASKSNNMQKAAIST